MLNALAAALRLTTHQLLGQKRRTITVILLLLPTVLAIIFRVYSPGMADAQYTMLITGVFANVLVPFLAIYWGTVLLSDEIEGRTLVYLWTRPVGRAKLFLLKFLTMAFWLLVLLVPSMLLVFAALFLDKDDVSRFVGNFPMPLWDLRGLFLGGVAYGALALFLATMVKKPLVVGLVYLFAWDGFFSFLPGFLKRFSLRHYMYILGSHPKEGDPTGFFKFLAETTTTENQAIVTLLGVTAAFLVLAALLLSTKEYLADDPARNK